MTYSITSYRPLQKDRAKFSNSLLPYSSINANTKIMSGGYYDIGNILAEEERVPIVFATPAHDLGYLVEGCQDQDVDSGTKVDLPYWLAERLAIKKYITFETPHFYHEKYRNSIIADPKSADLRQCCQVFYQLGMRVAPWLGQGGDERARLEKDLVIALTERFHSILDHSQNSQNEDNTSFTNMLSATELQLYWEGFASAGDYKTWKHSRTQQLKESWLVDLHQSRRKRRRLK